MMPKKSDSAAPNKGGRPKKDPLAGAFVTVAARITVPEKEALDRLVAERATALAAEGITGQDTFPSWLRFVIRDKAKAAGFAVQDAPAPGASSSKKAKRGAK
jgi:hypothetical protein